MEPARKTLLLLLLLTFMFPVCVLICEWMENSAASASFYRRIWVPLFFFRVGEGGGSLEGEDPRMGGGGNTPTLRTHAYPRFVRIVAYDASPPPPNKISSSVRGTPTT